MLGAIISIGGLSFFAGKANHRSNGFIRLVPPHVAMPEKIRDLWVNSYYLAGGTTTRFWLGNYTAPNLITGIDLGLADSSTSRLSMHSAGGRFARSLKITIDSPAIWLFEGVTPTIVRGRLGDSLLHRSPGKFYFGLAAPLSTATSVFRVVDDRRHQNILVKQTTDSLILGENILEKQVDGIFCTDGALHTQPGSNRIIYIYNYRNQFICIDTNLHVLYKTRTIDTVSRAKFTVGFIPSEKSYTLSSPPQFVNKESCVSGNYLFVHSGLHADNEEMDIYRTSSPIDVYSLLDGKYLLSFYLPDYKHKKVRDFQVFGNTLIALYDHYAYSYSLQIPEKLKQ